MEFEWYLKGGLPSILDSKALMETYIILTDQDEQLVGILLYELSLTYALSMVWPIVDFESGTRYVYLYPRIFICIRLFVRPILS